MPEAGAINLKRIETLFLACRETDCTERYYAYAQFDALLRRIYHIGSELVRRREIERMDMQQLTPAKRKRLLKTFGSFPAGYTHDDLERFLDLLYGQFSDVYTLTELRQIQVSDPFDHSEHPRQLRLVELTDWLEALVA
ncbi:MAG TPA: hypothetical protein VEI53_09790 [Ktedonobacteraceae bacterium]|nr:hypothetical protein [Ktedonobacteraceae bacterium]